MFFLYSINMIIISMIKAFRVLNVGHFAKITEAEVIVHLWSPEQWKHVDLGVKLLREPKVR